MTLGRTELSDQITDDSQGEWLRVVAKDKTYSTSYGKELKGDNLPRYNQLKKYDFKRPTLFNTAKLVSKYPGSYTVSGNSTTVPSGTMLTP